MNVRSMRVKITLDQPMLGTCSKNKEVYKTYIASKASTAAKALEEVQTVQELEEKGWTGFNADEKGLFIFDHMIRGYLKNAGNILKDQLKLKNVKSKIDNLVFVAPEDRRIYLMDGKKYIKKPHDVVERPLRAMTMQGPRVSLTRSDAVKEGTTLEFTLKILDNPEITPKVVSQLFEYGKFQGLGQWRNGSYGRFTAATKIL